MSTYHTFPDQEKVAIYKKAGVSIPEPVLAKIKKEFSSDYVFYCRYDKEKNKWIFTVDYPELIKNSNEAFDTDTESIIIFGRSIFGNSVPPFSWQKDEAPWFVTMSVGDLSIYSNHEKRHKEFFEFFLKHQSIKNAYKTIAGVCKLCPAVSFAAINSTEGIKMFGKWEERHGLYFSDVNCLDKMTFEQRSFFSYVLSYLSGEDTKTKYEHYRKFKDSELLKEVNRVPELAEKGQYFV